MLVTAIIGITFWHLPPSFAGVDYATEGALFYLHTAVHQCSQHPPKVLGMHTHKHEVHPPIVYKKKVPSPLKQFCFYLCWHKQCGQL